MPARARRPYNERVNPAAPLPRLARLRAWADTGPAARSRTDLPRVWGASWSTIERLRDDRPLRRDEPLSWLLTAALTALAFVIRFPNLRMAPYIEFDETYYAKEAWSVLTFGYARAWPPGDTVNPMLNDGADPLSVVLSTADRVVHPMLAKWLIAGGIHLFGFNPFGWRFGSLIVGCLLVAAVVRLARRLARSTLIGGLAGLFICVDGLSVVMSRIALLDIFEAFFTVAAVAVVVRDRDWFRERLARYLEKRGQPNLDGHFGPVLWWRPWRLLAGVLFGLACGCKWNAMYVLAIMGVVTLAFDWHARRTAGARGATWRSLLVDGPLSFIYLVIVAIVSYVGTWASWFATSEGSFRQWGAENPDTLSVRLLGKPLASLWAYHVDIWKFHTGEFMSSVTHPWDAKPWGWLVMRRPISIAVDHVPSGVEGCRARLPSDCVRVVLAIGTPFLWWMAAIAIVAGLAFWIFGRDWRFAVPVLGAAATWVGWFPNADRPLFFFYAIMIIPFTATILALCLGKILGPPSAGRRRQRGALIVAACTVLIVINFAFLYPVLTDQLLTDVGWGLRIWFRTWA